MLTVITTCLNNFTLRIQDGANLLSFFSLFTCRSLESAKVDMIDNIIPGGVVALVCFPYSSLGER